MTMIKKNKLLFIFALCILLICSLIAFQLFKPHFTEKPKNYTIGTTVYTVEDMLRTEIFKSERNEKRKLIVQFWYPAMASDRTDYHPYIENAGTVTASIAELLGRPKFLFSPLKYKKSYALRNEKISSQRRAFPLIIYITGKYGFRSLNMFQIQELVSQGYIVAGIDIPGAVAAAVFPDGEIIKSISKEKLDSLILKSISDVAYIPEIYGKEMKDGIIPYFSQDVSSVINFVEKLNQKDCQHIFTNRIDTSRIGVLGVSLGGIIASEAAAYDKRIKASLIMESRISKNALSKNISSPLMIITRDAESMRNERNKSGGWSETDIQTHLTTMNTLYENSTSDSYLVQIPGMFHVDFTDTPLWFPFSRYLGLNGKLKPQEVHSILNTFTINFFDKELLGKESSLLKNPTVKYQNIIYKSKQKL